MILIGIGANLTHPIYGPPRATLGVALAALEKSGLVLSARSRWYKSAPVPLSEQPWFINAVIQFETPLDPSALMNLLLNTEKVFGRVRAEKNNPRLLDLDLLVYDAMVIEEGNVVVPHPRLTQRAFVLLPMADIAPDWRHPVSGLAIDALISALPPEQQTEAIPDVDGIYGTEWRKSGANR